MNDFTTELLALLAKYDATISWACSPCSDLHGVYGECMEVTNRKGVLMKLQGSDISAYDIKCQLTD